MLYFSCVSREDWHGNLKKSTKYLFHGKVSSIFNEKKTKTEGRFENGKNIKKEDICFLWELNSWRFVMAEVCNYLENRFNEKKKRIFVFVESWTQDLS